MAIRIAPAAGLAAADLARHDFSFAVTEEAVPPFAGDTITATVAVIPPYRKSYDLADIVPGPDKALFVAWSGGEVGGYLLLGRGWNNCAVIQDIAVDRASRRHGIGAALIGTAIDWTRSQGLPAIRLETQSNNVPACRFYARMGFRLGGHDRHLYAALGQGAETALFWYLFL